MCSSVRSSSKQEALGYAHGITKRKEGGRDKEERGRKEGIEIKIAS